MRRVGRSDDDLTTLANELAAIDAERRLAMFNDKHLRIWMPMHVRSSARRAMHQDQRDRYVEMGANELMRVPGVWQSVTVASLRRCKFAAAQVPDQV